MNGNQLKFQYIIPENNKKYAVDGIAICLNCGSVKTTILRCAIYCRACRSFRLYKEMTRRSYALTGTVWDLD